MNWRAIWHLLIVPVILGIAGVSILIGFVTFAAHEGHLSVTPRPAATAPAHYPRLVPPVLPRPVQPHPAVLTYHVRSGDTLWGIAGAHCGNPLKWPHLWHANQKLIHDPDLIYPRMEIHLVC